MITGSAGAKFFIGPITPAANAAAYAALAWTEVGEVESLGDFGDQAETVRFTGLSDARTRKFKGAKDAGDMSVTVGYDARDPGQIALIAAEATKFAYACKVVLADSPDANDTDSTFYFHAKVSSKRLGVGAVNDVPKRTFILGIDTEIFEEPSEAVA